MHTWPASLCSPVPGSQRSSTGGLTPWFYPARGKGEQHLVLSQLQGPKPVEVPVAPSSQPANQGLLYINCGIRPLFPPLSAGW